MSFNLIGWRELFGKVFWLHFSCYKTVSCCHCHLDPPPSILKIAKNQSIFIEILNQLLSSPSPQQLFSDQATRDAHSILLPTALEEVRLIGLNNQMYVIFQSGSKIRSEIFRPNRVYILFTCVSTSIYLKCCKNLSCSWLFGNKVYIIQFKILIICGNLLYFYFLIISQII